MAGDWIKVEMATPNKPEVLKASRMLGITKDDTFGKMMRFWLWLDSICVDGHVDGVVSTDVDAVVGIDGFASALKSVGWLDFDDISENLTVPNFERHNGETAKKRVLKNRRQQKWRNKENDQVDTEASTREEKKRNKEKVKKERTSDYTPEFESAWSEYPKREGSNPKRKAFQAWTARIKSGVDPHAMHQGVIRYAQFVRAKGQEHTSFVKQAATFFGPDDYYMESWVVNQTPQAKPADQFPTRKKEDLNDYL